MKPDKENILSYNMEKQGTIKKRCRWNWCYSPLEKKQFDFDLILDSIDSLQGVRRLFPSKKKKSEFKLEFIHLLKMW